MVNTEEAAALAEGNELSFLRVSRPEIELPAGTDLYSDEVYAKAVANFKRLYKAASASHAAAACRKANSTHTGKEDYNFFLAVTFPADQLRILPYNRAVKDLNGMTSAEFLKKIGEKFTIAPASLPNPRKAYSSACIWTENGVC